ncbi:MAG: hypothetical protein ACREFP_14345 [Acetobacteraceae bacterium]
MKRPSASAVVQAGFNRFLTARAVGPARHVTGVAMMPEMVERCRRNATKRALESIRFWRGEVSHLVRPMGSLMP